MLAATRVSEFQVDGARGSAREETDIQLLPRSIHREHRSSEVNAGHREGSRLSHPEAGQRASRFTARPRILPLAGHTLPLHRLSEPSSSDNPVEYLGH